MPARRGLRQRVGLLVLATAAVSAGVLVGLSGCGGPCRCPAPTQVAPGTYTIVDSEWPELVDALVEITAERVEISFTDAEGQDWVIDYEIGRH